MSRIAAIAWLVLLVSSTAALAQNRPPQGRRGRDEEAITQLGKAAFFDVNLSNPPGLSCASCHAPETGFSYPNSHVNHTTGTVPGVQATRFGNRKPMTISYAWFAPAGPTFWNRRQAAWTGGFFADGRADDLQSQAAAPLANPNEMDNTLHGAANPDLVVQKVLAGSYVSLLKLAFGDDAATKSSTDIYRMVRQGIASYERSREVSPFSSKYDAYVAGDAQLSASELNGLRLFTGSITGRPGGTRFYKDAQCSTCHTISESSDDGSRRDFFTNWTYANIGVPKNTHNPYYRQTNLRTNPMGYNPSGNEYVDLGLGGVLYPQQNLPAGNAGPGSNGRGDYLEVNGTFRVASLRNVDKRPYAGFVKCYMHNGVFKSLKEVVHFYNTRNLNYKHEPMDLTAAPEAGSGKAKPLWPAPEYPSPVTLQNPTGRPNSRNARVGNLGLTDAEEGDIVAFLQTLSDGYFTPPRRRPPPGPPGN